MKILLIDDHKLFAKSMKLLLEADSEIEEVFIVSEHCTDIDEILERAADLILVDINLNNIVKESGLKIAEKIIKKKPSSKVIILTGYNRVMYEAQAINMGASGFVDKNVEPEKMIKILKQVFAGGKYYRDINTGIQNGLKDENGIIYDRLTVQEIRILKLIKQGETIDNISDRVYISKRTVNNHLNRIFEKLYVSNRHMAILKAEKLGYFEPA